MKNIMEGKHLVFVLVMVVLILLNAATIFAGEAQLSWTAPTKNADNTTLTDLSGYTVYYGTSSGNYSNNIDIGNVTSYQLTGLTDGLTYYFSVTAYDTSGNESAFADEVSKVMPLPDTTPPVISAIQSISITSVSGRISWVTNEESNTQVEYGTTTSYGSTSTLDSTMTLNHAQTLNNLSSNTLYHYRVRSTDAAGNQAVSGDYTFTTAMQADTTPPVISGVQSSGITDTAAAIAWTTNETSDTQVEYGTTTAYGNTTTLNTSLVTSHSQNLTGLTSSTLYHYRVRSSDAAGNSAVSGDYTFTTEAPVDTSPPYLTGVQSSSITDSAATITWTSNEASDSQIEYGTTYSYGNTTTLNSSLVTSHSQDITNLLPSTLYRYRVRSRDAAGNLTLSASKSFTTAAPPDTTPPGKPLALLVQ